MVSEACGLRFRMLAAGALAAALAGCGVTSEQSALAPPGGASESNSALPTAAGDLIYVLDNGSERVYQYSYETRKRLGTIKTRFADAESMCVDGAQNVFVVDNATQAIWEYSPGGKSVIRILIDFVGFPFACAVDPTTGNLAVTNRENSYDEFPGNVVIYPHVTGKPKAYEVLNMYEIYFPAFDDKGNLFVDGYSTYFRGSLLSELPKNGKNFVDLTLSSKIASAFGMQWDGKYLAVCDIGPQPNEIDRYSMSRFSAKKVSSTILKEANYVYQFFVAAIGGKDVVVGADPTARKLYAWQYPLGGSPSFSIGGFIRPFGAVIAGGS
jgi:DNA-binding beta-propeller fold protein YncE